jgi:hypothetical protein
MSRSRMFGDDPRKEKDPRQRDNGSPRRTIVGGRPPESRSKLPPVPTGLQTLLRMASVDAEFCNQLVRRRAEMAEAAGVVLTASEKAMLQAVSEKQLRVMAQGLPAPAMDRRNFLRQSARAAVLVLGGAALTGCSQKSTKKEAPPARKKVNQMQTEGGADPHVAPPRKRPTDAMKARDGDDEKKRVDAGTQPSGTQPSGTQPSSRPPTEDGARSARRADPAPPPRRPSRRRMTRRGGSGPGIPRPREGVIDL